VLLSTQQQHNWSNIFLRTSSQSVPLLWSLSLLQSVSAVPVVNEEGKLVGNVSASDIHYLVDSPIIFELVAHTEFSVIDFFASLKERLVAQNGANVQFFPSTLIKPRCSQVTVLRPISVLPSATLSQVIDKMISNQVHRVYVVDNTEKPQGVVSLIDVLRVMVTQPPGFYEKILLDKWCVFLPLPRCSNLTLSFL
jgi:CBS domain-containing protein